MFCKYSDLVSKIPFLTVEPWNLDSVFTRFLVVEMTGSGRQQRFSEGTGMRRAMVVEITKP